MPTFNSILSLLLPLLMQQQQGGQNQASPMSARFNPPTQGQGQDWLSGRMFVPQQNPDPGISPDQWQHFRSVPDLRFHQELLGQIVRGLQGQQLPQGSPLQGMSKPQLLQLFLDLSWAPKTGI